MIHERVVEVVSDPAPNRSATTAVRDFTAKGEHGQLHLKASNVNALSLSHDGTA